MKSTDDLLKDLAAAETIDDYISQNHTEFAEISLSDYLGNLLAQKNMKKSDVIRRADLNDIYAYQIFSGIKKPTRDKVLALAFGFQLTVPETQQLLKCCDYPFLYAKHKRDSIILFALYRQLPILEVNNLLFDMDEELLL